MMKSLAFSMVVLGTTVAGQEAIRVPGSDTTLMTWATPEGSFWKASTDGGRTFSPPRRTRFDLMLRHGAFDPLAALPPVAEELRARESSRLRIVQLAAPALPPMLEAIEAAGATLLFYLPHHSYIVDVDPAAVDAISALPFVR